MSRYSKEDCISTLQYEYTRSMRESPSRISNIPKRDKLHSWAIDLLPEIQCSIHTRLLGCSYLDHYLRSKPDTNPEAYCLLAVVSFSFALKFEESFIITPQQISEMFDKKYSPEDVKTLELYFLLTLDWNLAKSTSPYIARLLLDATCDGNCEKIAEKADRFCIMGEINSVVAKNGEFLVAVAAVSLALKSLGFLTFLEEWWVEVQKYVDISRVENDKIARCILGLFSN